MKSDTVAVQSLIDGIFRDYGLALDLEGPESYLLDPGGYCRSTGGDYWVLASTGTIIATVGILLHDDKNAELKSLYVNKNHRGHGLGSLLTRHIIHFAQQAGRTRLFLWSDTRFTDAHRLYRRLGFRQMDERRMYDKYDSSEYGFELDLKPGSSGP